VEGGLFENWYFLLLSYTGDVVIITLVLLLDVFGHEGLMEIRSNRIVNEALLSFWFAVQIASLILEHHIFIPSAKQKQRRQKKQIVRNWGG
jgi:hypothetical protein